MPHRPARPPALPELLAALALVVAPWVCAGAQAQTARPSSEETAPQRPRIPRVWAAPTDPARNTAETPALDSADDPASGRPLAVIGRRPIPAAVNARPPELTRLDEGRYFRPTTAETAPSLVAPEQFNRLPEATVAQFEAAALARLRGTEPLLGNEAALLVRSRLARASERSRAFLTERSERLLQTAGPSVAAWLERNRPVPAVREVPRQQLVPGTVSEDPASAAARSGERIVVDTPD